MPLISSTPFFHGEIILSPLVSCSDPYSQDVVTFPINVSDTMPFTDREITWTEAKLTEISGFNVSYSISHNEPVWKQAYVLLYKCTNTVPDSHIGLYTQIDSQCGWIHWSSAGGTFTCGGTFNLGGVGHYAISVRSQYDANAGPRYFTERWLYFDVSSSGTMTLRQRDVKTGWAEYTLVWTSGTPW